ncbi:MAG: universal stress protein [Cyanobacteria bacterium P01_A01_bin.84]
MELIILGRKGHKAIAEALLGIASSHVMHRVPCTILVIQQA